MDEKLVVKEELTNLLEEQEKIRSRVRELQEKQSTAGLESIIKGASNVQNLTDCKDGDIIEVCGAVQRNTRYGLSYIIVDGKGTAHWADAQTKYYLSKLKPTATHNGCDVICNRFNLKILGHRWTSSRNRCVRTEISAAENIKELEEPIPKPPLPKKNNLGKPKDYNKLDGLAVGTVLDVKEYGILTVRGKDRHVIFTDKGAYIDNWFLREIYANLDELTVHKIVCLGLKTTKQKVRAMFVRIL